MCTDKLWPWWTFNLLAQDRYICSDSRYSCWGAAGVLYRGYISTVVSWMVLVVAVVSGQSVHHRGSGRMAVRDPWPCRGAEATAATGKRSLSASPRLWVLDEPLQRDICTQAHGFMMTAGPDMIIQLCFQFNQQPTYVILLLTRDRVAADLSVLNGR